MRRGNTFTHDDGPAEDRRLRAARSITFAGLAVVGAFAAGRFAHERLGKSARAEAASTASVAPHPASVPATWVAKPVDDAVASTPTTPNAKEWIAQLLAEPAAHVRQLALWESLRGANEARVRELLEALPRDSDNTIANGLRPLLYRRWGELDPLAAIKNLERLDYANRHKAETGVIRGWTTRDASAAFAWMAAEHGKDGKNGDLLFRLTLPFVTSLSETGAFPELAPRLAAVPASSGRYLIITTEFASAWAQTDPNAALRWIAQLPEGSVRNSATSAALRQVTREAPDLALGIVQTLSNEKERTEGFQSVFWTWSRLQPEGARRTIDTQLTGRDRDVAQAAFATVIARKEPQGAIDRVVSIEDPQLRVRAAMEVRNALDRDHDLDLASLVQLRLLSDTDGTALAKGLAADFSRRDPAVITEFLRTTTLLTAEQRAQIEAARPPKP